MAATPIADDRIDRMGFLLMLRRRGITDREVLRAMDEVPREHFVSPEYVATAYTDRAMPIACGQTISQPYVVAYMTERLAVGRDHRVLEIGTGSGYQAAVLSRLAREVVTVERFRTLAQTAQIRFETLGYSNIALVVGDGMEGVADHAPFDRIIVTAAAETVPPALLEQLAEGGVMLLPLGPLRSSQSIMRLTKKEGGIQKERLIAVRFVPLLSGKAKEL